MSSKKIYLIRHGETDFNRLGIVQGSGVDSSLNETGRRQASAFFRAYQHVVFSKVYVSTLRRTIESVEGFLGRGVPHEALPGLNEIGWGNKEGKPVTAVEDAYYQYILDEWRKGNTGLAIEGGESPDDVYHRLSRAMDYILSFPDEDPILICMHGRAMRILLCHLMDLPLSQMDVFEHANLGLYLIHHNQASIELELRNDTSHLRDLS